jgi:hypothetical protein
MSKVKLGGFRVGVREMICPMQFPSCDGDGLLFDKKKGFILFYYL